MPGTLPPISCVVVGVDGSANAAAAMAHAAVLASASGARIVAVHAVGLLVELSPGAVMVPSEQVRDELRRRFETEWCRPLADAGVPYEAELEAGEAVGALLRVADREDAWAIIVGMRGHNPFGGPLGSTSLQLVAGSARPILVVPPRAVGP